MMVFKNDELWKHNMIRGRRATTPPLYYYNRFIKKWLLTILKL